MRTMHLTPYLRSKRETVAWDLEAKVSIRQKLNPPQTYNLVPGRDPQNC